MVQRIGSKARVSLTIVTGLSLLAWLLFSYTATRAYWVVDNIVVELSRL